MKPTEAQTVDQIKAYLEAHGIKYQTTMNKPDLLALVNGGGN